MLKSQSSGLVGFGVALPLASSVPPGTHPFPSGASRSVSGSASVESIIARRSLGYRRAALPRQKNAGGVRLSVMGKDQSKDQLTGHDHAMGEAFISLALGWACSG